MTTSTSYTPRVGEANVTLTSRMNVMRAIGIAVILLAAAPAAALGPDLTVGTNRFAVDRTNTRNLGPTGMRGWIYNRPTYGFLTGDQGTMTADQPWQILVTDVGTGTPAVGILQVDDVILGAKAGSGTVPLFTNDSRKSLGWAIGDAEAGDGTLRLLVNRYGVATNQQYTIQLGLTGLAYSVTAPYNCPKSAKILADAINIISNKAFSLGGVGNPVLGLAKMAVGITNADLKTYAASIASPGTLNPFFDAGSGYISWDWGYKSVFLTEYFLFTGDTSVTNGIREYAMALAHAKDMYGLMGHKGTEDHHDGTFNDRNSSMGYGPMNSASLPGSIGLVLTKKCGIGHTDIDGAIARGNVWFNYFVGKGIIGYGEHEAGPDLHASNGKIAMAAMYFALQGDKPAQAEYFERMSVAEYNARELGHTGTGFSYLWLALAAHMGGMTSMYSHLAPIRWHLDLSRRSNGSFIYDGAEQYGGSEQPSYWGSAQYGSMEPTTWYVLLYGAPYKKIYVTGKGLSPTNALSTAAVSNAIWAGMYNQICSGYTTNQLLSHFGEYDPAVRWWAASTLAKSPGSNTLLNLLITLTTNTDPRVRATACQALGTIKMTNAIPTLLARSYDTDAWVRDRANAALEGFGTSVSAITYLTNILVSFTLHGTTNQYEVPADDPLLFANEHLQNLLFNTLGSTTIGQSTNLLYPAFAVAVAAPGGHARGSISTFMSTRLSWTQVQGMAPSLVQCAMELAPADRMFAKGPLLNAILTLAKYKVEEGIPLAVRYLDKYIYGMHGGVEKEVLACLSNTYRKSAWEALPVLQQYQPYLPGSPSYPDNATALANAIDALQRTNGPALVYFKTITAFSSSATQITLPTNITFRCAATDLDKGIPSYTWSKTQGVGTVTFTPNSTPGATNVTASFSAPGTYVIRMACVDSSILDTSTWKWSGAEPAWRDFRTYTNLIGAVYTNLTVIVYGLSFVNITNADYTVTDFPQLLIAGTNNTAAAGFMRLTSVANGVTNYTASIAAATPWSVVVSNLAPMATNYVTITVTNGLGVATNDTVMIYRNPMPYLNITNVIGSILVPDTSNTWRIAGTNNVYVVGGLVWTNAAIGGGNGAASPAPGNWSFNVALVPGFNIVTVYGTNAGGVCVMSSATVIRGATPCIDITNLDTTVVHMRPSTIVSEYVAGTNTTPIVGGMTWTNLLGGGGTLVPGGWNFTAPLALGTNVIIVKGTNVTSAVFADTVMVFRATAPVVDITNTGFTVAMGVSNAVIGGTHNAVVVGTVRLASLTGSTTNYAAIFPAGSPWIVTVSNLVAGATNLVTVTATNFLGESAADMVQIYRRPVACVDITNLPGDIQVDPATTDQYVAGTNSFHIVGTMNWSNNAGYGGTLTPGDWSFSAPLVTGTNVITVTGTNSAGDVASDAITVTRKAFTFYWTNAAGGVWSVAGNWTNDISTSFAPEAAGKAFYRLSFYTPGTYTAVNDLNAGFLLNQLNFGGATARLRGNDLTLTNADAQLPQINQNSAATVIFSNNMVLATNVTIGGTGTGLVSQTGVLTGPGGLTITAPCLALFNGLAAGANTYSGGTRADKGTLVIGQKNAFGPGNVTLGNGVVFGQAVFEGNSAAGALPYAFVLSGGTSTFYVAQSGIYKDIWIANVISGSGMMLPDGGGNRQLSLAGDNTFSGGVLLKTAGGGGLQILHSNALGTGTVFSQKPTVMGGAAGNGYYLRAGANLSASPGVQNTFLIETNCYLPIRLANPMLISGSITGNGGLAKNGTATLTLSGANTYTGPTVVIQGTLECTTPESLGAGYLIISNGAVVNLNYGGSRVIAALSLGGTNQPYGTYGSLASPAMYKSAFFDGNGIVEVGNLPFVDITNITGTIVVTNDTQEIAGINNTNTVVMWWENSLGGYGTLDPEPGVFSFIAEVYDGNNVIVVYGANEVGMLSVDTVTVYRSTIPFVDILSDNSSVPMDLAIAQIDGTNNGAFGDMGVVSVAGGITNYSTSIAVATPWSLTVSNLVAGMTNYVTASVSNANDDVATDMVEIYRRPVAYVDITNITVGSVDVPSDTPSQYIAGTNSSHIMGIMWTNSAGYGGELTPGGWSFTTPLAMGHNIITVTGTNDAGDVASDMIDVKRGTLQLPVLNDLIVWLRADAIDTNDTVNQVRYDAGSIYVQQWNDQTYYYHNASNVTVSDQPQYIQEGVNYMPSLRFAQLSEDNGSRLYLGDLGSHFPSGATLFVVGSLDNDARYNLFGNRALTETWVDAPAFSSHPGSFRTATATGTFTYDQWPQSDAHVFSLESGSSVYRMLIDGTNVGSDTASYHSGAGANWTIGNRSTSGQQLRGDIPELILYSRVLSTNEADEVGRYLADKYGLATAYPAMPPDAKILQFGQFTNYAVITGTSIDWVLPPGTSLTNLAPEFALSTGATCDRGSGVTNDFSSPVLYTVISWDKAVTNVYTVTTTLRPLQTDAQMLSFGPGATILGNEVTWRVPNGTAVTNLSPTYTMSAYAAGYPASGTARDFTSPQTYTILAEDGVSSNIYTVTVTVSPMPWINMNYDRSDAPTTNALFGPCGGLGDTWNNVTTNIVWPGITTNANMLDYAGTPTAVDLIVPNAAFWTDVDGPLGMLKTHRGQFDPNAVWTIVFEKLDPTKKYDFYFGTYRTADDGKGMYWTPNVTSGPNTNYYDNGGANGVKDRWIEGTNYIRFVEVVPDAASNVSFSIIGRDGKRSQLNGFQIVVVTPPLVRITNVTGIVTVPNAVTTQYIAGTNNEYTVGGIAWTNSLGGGGSVPVGDWNFTADLYPGANVISVKGTNSLGEMSIHSVTIIRAVTPYVDITNANRSVSMNVTAVTIGGTNNNPGPVGMMQLASVVGGVTNYTAVLPAVTPWTVAVSNLAAGVTNFVTMTVTNGVGQTASDTVQVYRRPIAVLDITNIVDRINTTNATITVAGTNNPFIVGGMVWTNSLGGNGTLNPVPGNWSFSVTVYPGDNYVTVYGTNGAGELATDMIVIAPPSPSNDILSCSFGSLGNATINGTNITIEVMPVQPIAALAPTFVISDNATINPPSGSTNDFTTPRTFIVTSQSGSNKAYRVSVTTWQHKGSLYTVTTPESANLPGAALESNFPLLVRLNQYNFDFAQAQPDGRDIRFCSPAGVRYPYQIEEWTNNTAIIWVLIPAVAGNTHQEFVMCWGRTNVTSESVGSNVFNNASGCAAVLHLDAALKDEAGAVFPVNAGSTVGNGIIGRGRTMALGQGVNCGTAISNLPIMRGQWSTEFWYKSPSAGSDIMGWGPNVWQASKAVYQLKTPPPHINVDGWFGGASVAGTTTAAFAEWHHVVQTFTNNVSSLYVDGVLDKTSTGWMTNLIKTVMYLGGWAGTYNYQGDMDEVRVSRMARSANYVKMSFENQKTLNKLVGPIVQSGTTFTTMPTALTINEGTTTNIVSQAGGARKLYWVSRKGGVDTLLAVDQFTLPFTPWRVISNESFTIEFRGVYATEVKTNIVPVTIVDTVPDPVFTLLPSTNLWDGRSVMTVTTNIANWAALLASGYTNLTYSWTVDGVAVIKQEVPGTLILTRSQGSGDMTVRLVLDNGGAKITNTVVVTVQEPGSDPWIVRTPDANEKPVHNQFYARDDSGMGTLYYNGTEAGGSPDAFLKVYTNGVLYTNLVQTLGGGGSYAFTAKLPAGLIQHTVDYGTGAVVLATVTNVVCGDAYLVDGQSNAVTMPDDGQEPNPYTNLWIRCYGATLGWGYGTRGGNRTEHMIGHWQMDVASNIVALNKMPVCMINGAVGGTRIDVHQKGGTIYDSLYSRIMGAKLSHGIRAAFWYQGENNQGADGPDPDYDYKFYQQYFVDMTADWKTDYPNLRNYYVFQIWPAACGMGPMGDQLRDVQRNLVSLYSPHLKEIAICGVVPGVGCHTSRAGYLRVGQLVTALVKEDIYGLTGTTNSSANLRRAYYNGASQVNLEFDQNVAWNSLATDMFFLDDVAGQVASGSAVSNVVTLQLTGPSSAKTITYLDDQQGWATNHLIWGVNGVAVLTFADVSLVTTTTNVPSDVKNLVLGRGPAYDQMQLSWSNGLITVLACTNRSYTTNMSYWFVLASGVSTPWTHTAASNFPSVYYRIVGGSYTSAYAVGKYDVDIAPGSIAWLSFPFAVQSGCDIVAEWFGQQLEVRPYTSYDFPVLQRQTTPGGTIENNDYYFDDFGGTGTNWFPTNTVAANAGYVLFLPQNHGAVKVTGIGMVQTNNVTMQMPYNSIPWVGLAYDVVMDMRQSGLTNMLQPPRLYSTFNYDFVDSQQTPGGPIWYAEYYRDNWGGNTVNFFPSETGADMLEPGKGYLLFFSTSRAGTGTWTCVKPY